MYHCILMKSVKSIKRKYFIKREKDKKVHSWIGSSCQRELCYLDSIRICYIPKKNQIFFLSGVE